MTQELKEKWMAALRSGRYKQTRGALRVNDNGEDLYCAIGVLCHEIDPTKWSRVSNFDDSWVRTRYGWQDDLPTKLRFDLLDYEHDAVVELNDGFGEDGDEAESFERIADWIEENVEVTT